MWSSTYAAGIPDSKKKYPFSASGSDIKEVLESFSQNTTIPVKIDNSVTGIVYSVPSGLNRIQFINFLALKHKFVWFFNGLVLYIESINSQSSKAIGLDHISVKDIKHVLQSLDLWEEKFVRFGADNAKILLLLAPRSYAMIVEQIISITDIKKPLYDVENTINIINGTSTLSTANGQTSTSSHTSGIQPDGSLLGDFDAGIPVEETLKKFNTKTNINPGDVPGL
jgi:type II secretory pathway component GspD/PulD (secretin)